MLQTPAWSRFSSPQQACWGHRDQAPSIQPICCWLGHRHDCHNNADLFRCSGRPMLRYHGPTGGSDDNVVIYNPPWGEWIDVVTPQMVVFAASWVDLRTRFPPDSTASRYLQLQGVKGLIWGKAYMERRIRWIPFSKGEETEYFGRTSSFGKRDRKCLGANEIRVSEYFCDQRDGLWAGGGWGICESGWKDFRSEKPRWSMKLLDQVEGHHTTDGSRHIEAPQMCGQKVWIVNGVLLRQWEPTSAAEWLRRLLISAHPIKRCNAAIIGLISTSPGKFLSWQGHGLA